VAGPATTPAAGPPRDSRRLTLVISALALGGAEWVMTVLAHEWAAAGRTVTLINFAGPDEVAFYPLDPAVQEIRLDLRRHSPNPFVGIVANLRRIVRIRRAIRRSRPDVVISFIDRTNVLTLAATIGSSVPVIVAEHTDPRHGSAGRAWSTLRLLLYRRAAAVLVLTRGTLDAFPPAIRRRMVVMPNPAGRELEGRTPSALDEPTIVAIGRLSREKGYDQLLRAFARIAAGRPEWRVVIWGEGAERESLEALRAELGLADRVTLPGLTHQPLEELSGASILALPSRREGFPMVAVEALACGVPVVAFDCLSGPRELIRDRVDGRLIATDDIAGFADALAELMDDPAERRRLGANGPQIVGRFAIERILAAWEDLFANVSVSAR
jgi:GalNAc-alpha-(1->4)-GalNAc-alpha-(1->3)-diNAcBac-PP-undecaprenol alpha-1,4-N-acetyl-D-galactosaminyltransferase